MLSYLCPWCNASACGVMPVSVLQAQRGEVPSEDEAGSGSEKEESEEESSSSSSSSEEEEEASEAKVPKAKGVSGLIELENPNRQGNKANRKVTDLDTAGASAPAKPQLSRRERWARGSVTIVASTSW